MQVAVGYTNDKGGGEALELAVWLAQSLQGSVTVVTVVPDKWFAAAGTDAEYGAFIRSHARKALDKARSLVGNRVEADFVMRPADTAREGIVATAEDVGADLIVVGSARGGPAGRILEGSVSTDLVHDAAVPVVLCPRGYRPPVNSRLARLSVSFSSGAGSVDTAEQASWLAQEFSVPLRLVSFVTRDRQMFPTGAGYDAENMIVNQLRQQIDAEHEKALARIDPGIAAPAAIGDGPNWKEAMHSVGWETGELLVLGQSRGGQVLRFFLGSNTGKIIHNAPVPCLILPTIGASASSSRRPEGR